LDASLFALGVIFAFRLCCFNMSAPSGPAAWVAVADVAEMVAAAEKSDTSGCLNVTFAGLPEETWLQLQAEADFKGVNLTKTITMNVEPNDNIDLIRSKIWAITGIERELCLLTFFPQKTVLQDFIQFRQLRADPCTLHAHTPATAETAVEVVGPEVPLSQQEESREHYTSDEDSDHASAHSTAASTDYAALLAELELSPFSCKMTDFVQLERKCVACNDMVLPAQKWCGRHRRAVRMMRYYAKTSKKDYKEWCRVFGVRGVQEPNNALARKWVIRFCEDYGGLTGKRRREAMAARRIAASHF
jgi:hypothetical protein